MAALGDVYRIQCFFNVQNPNGAVDTYYYRVGTSGNAGADDVYAAFNTKFIAAYTSLLNENLDWAEVVVINGMDNSDFHISSTPVSGVRTGTVLHPAFTPVFRSALDAPGDRYSWHRPPFGSHSDVAALGALSASFLTQMHVYANDLNDTLSPTGGDVLEPVQVTGGFKLGTPPTVKRTLVGDWSVGTVFHWLDSRENVFTYTNNP